MLTKCTFYANKNNKRKKRNQSKMKKKTSKTILQGRNAFYSLNLQITVFYCIIVFFSYLNVSHVSYTNTCNK